MESFANHNCRHSDLLLSCSLGREAQLLQELETTKERVREMKDRTHERLRVRKAIRNLNFKVNVFVCTNFKRRKSGVFCTNNAQAPSLFSNVTLTSRRSYVFSTYDRLLVSVTLEKREGACALFVQKTPDMFTNLPSARKTLLVQKKEGQENPLPAVSCRNAIFKR